MPETRLLQFVRQMTRLVETPPTDEAQLMDQAAALMRDLIAKDDWLAPEMALAHPRYYQQHLLYGDPLDRFSLVSFVWGPGQQTPIHDHTVWGIIGMLRGAEYSQSYVWGQVLPFAPDPAARQQAGPDPMGDEQRLEPGDVARVSPRIGDIHRVRNALDDQVSISIHLYGGNIGRIERHVFSPDTGAVKPFVSGYSNRLAPNLWAPQTS